MLSRSVRVFSAVFLASAAIVVADEARRCSVAPRECEQKIRQMLSGRRYLGVLLEESNPGLLVKAIVPDGPADRAELHVGDRFLSVNARRPATISDFKQILNDAKETGRLLVIVQRHGSLKKVEVRLEPYTKAQIDKIVAQHLAESHTTTATAPQPKQ
jgi:predicted metalloprotease with PDZ domain